MASTWEVAWLLSLTLTHPRLLSSEYSLEAICFSSCNAEKTAESWQLLRAGRGLEGAGEGPLTISEVSLNLWVEVT